MNQQEHRYDTAELGPVRKRSPEERRRKPHRRMRERLVPRWAYRIILILLLCVLVMLGWFNRQNLTPSNVVEWVRDRVVGMGVGDGFPYSIAGSSVSKLNFISADRNLIVASDTSLTILNSTALGLMDRQHSFSNPVVKAAGTRALLYNLGGKGCQVESIGKTLAKFSAPGNILAGAISTGGRYALLTEADGYCGLLTVYLSDNQVQSRYWFSDYYPTAVALNPDGTEAAVTGVSTKDGAMASAVYLLDLNNSKTASPFAEYADNLLFSVAWDDASDVTAVGDHAAELINAASRSKAEYSYNGLQPTAYAMDSGRIALGLSSYEDSDDAKLVLLNQSASPAVSASLSKTVESVSVEGQGLGALSGGKVYFYSLSGTGGQKSADAGGDARAIALRDENSAYVLGVSEIRLVSGR